MPVVLAAEVGVFSQQVAVGYDLIVGHLTPAEKRAITEAAYRNPIEPTVEEHFLSNRMPIAVSNWMANSVGGTISLDVALHGDAPSYKARLGTALAKLSVAYDHLLSGLFLGTSAKLSRPATGHLRWRECLLAWPLCTRLA